MSRNISEVCLEIGKTINHSGASLEACNKVYDLLFEITQAKNEIYLQGRTDQKHEDLDAHVILTKHEIKELETSLIKKILAAIKSEYDLNYGEILLNPKDFYDLVEGYLPSDNEINVNGKEIVADENLHSLALGTKVKYIGPDEILRDKVFYIDGYNNEENKYLLSYEKDHKHVHNYKAIAVDVNDIELLL